MGVIRLLDEQTISQIAAGEVIERPASVVKELVENAIDAGAGRIRVELTDGGRTMIRVTDDGSGMSPEDAQSAFISHATSKIRSIADLDEVRTMGFRGEALPSIASVSLTQVLTREAGAGSATLVRYQGGQLIATEEAAGPPGTQVTVRNLFYNVPARLKFLKAVATETSAAVEAVGRAAVARPDIAFSVEVGGRVSLHTDGRGDRLAVILELWGRDVAGLLVPVGLADGALRVEGFVGRPEAHRRNRSRQLLLINGRPVQSAALSKAFEEAYAGLLPSGRRPVGVILLDVPGEAVDINVHPAKAEVRLAREREAFSFVRAGVAGALRGGSMIREVAAGAAWGGSVLRELPPETAAAWPASVPASGAAPPAAGDLLGVGGEAGFGAPSGGPSAGAPSSAVAPWPELRPLGQLHHLYLVAEGPDGLYLIDQHAAHERIIYDRLAGTGGGRGQPLLVPLSVELSADEAAAFERYRGALGEAGFEAEPFGPRSLLIRSVPAGTGESYGPKDVRDILDALTDPLTGEERRETDRDHARRAIAACRGAVKAQNPLFRSEMEALLRDLASTGRPLTCPHGRPTVIRLTLAELNRRFGRGAGVSGGGVSGGGAGGGEAIRGGGG
ncbi:MAG TPA: DNA mismatch repair endonuclease MutL [Bacillota bacterium]|jgi:DNA mismatch repair protein MutL